MKSLYSTPTCGIIKLYPSAIMATSNPNIKCHDSNKIEDAPQLSNKRGPFNKGMWDNMSQ